MSIQQGGAIVSSRPGAASVLGPIGPARTRTTEVVDRLMDAIQSGRLPLGARLPTEQELTAAMGVSRTVVREAVAALRAEGLVVSRQGLGMFVARDVQRRPFRIDPDGLLELRQPFFETPRHPLEGEKPIPTSRRGVVGLQLEGAKKLALGARAVPITEQIGRRQ